MKRSSIFSVALVACALVIGVACAVARPLVEAYHFMAAHAASAFSMASQAPAVKQAKPGWLVKAGAFAAAMAKRERPVLTSSWRMCPSA